MDLQTDTAGGASQSAPSASNNLPNLQPNSATSKRDKLKTLEFVRLMADNNQVLQQSTASQKAQQQTTQLLRQAQAQKAAAAMGQPIPATATPSTNGEPVGDFTASIDSPVTHIHNYPAPVASPVAPAVPTQSPPAAPTPAAAPSLMSRIAPYVAAAGLAAGAGGLGYGLSNRPTAPVSQSPPSAPVVTNTNSASGFNLELGDPKK